MATHDFFVSYNHRDQPWAEWIAWNLEAAKYTTKIQAWDFTAGSNFAVEMHNSLANSDRIVLVLSDHYLKSEFVRAEWAAMFATDPTGLERRLVPVRVSDCKPDGLLRTIVYIDLVGKDGDSARRALLAGIQSGRHKPAAPPTFPPTGAPTFPGSGPMTAAPAVESEELVIVLSGTFKAKDRALAEALLKHLRRLSKDSTLTIESIEPGSIRVTVRCRPEARTILEGLFASGELREIAGLAVERIGDLYTEKQKEEPERWSQEYRVLVGTAKRWIERYRIREYEPEDIVQQAVVRFRENEPPIKSSIKGGEVAVEYFRQFSLEDERPWSSSQPRQFEVVVRVASTWMQHFLLDRFREHKRPFMTAAKSAELFQEFARKEHRSGDEDKYYRQLERIDRALMRLQEENARQAEVIQLRYFSGLSYEEIAYTLGVARSVVKGRGRKGKELLRRYVADDVRREERRS